MRRTTLAMLAALVAVVVFGLLRPIRVESGVAAEVPLAKPVPAPMTTASAPTRTAVPTDRETKSAREVDFDATLARLVELSMRANEELARGELDKAKVTDVEAAELVKGLLEFVPDYELRALHALTGSAGSADPRATMTRHVLERLLYFGLQKLATLAQVGGRSAFDGFLLALLESSLLDEQVAEIIARLLVDQPYLGVAQEVEVMRLIELVPTHPWLAEPMRRLLLTLWRNLEAGGVRPRDGVETMALMLKDDTNPARRAAAIERLMLSGDRNLVDFVLRDVEEQRDAKRAADLAAPAATHLPPDQALEVVQRLRAVAQRPLTVSAIELSRRDGALVRTRYQELLASQSRADLRADLVMGLGCNPSSDNLAVANTALQIDPDPQVRRRALLAITGNAASALGEQAVSAALADRELCGPQGERLSVIVAALDNMARQGEHDAVARLGRQLGQRRDLAPEVRSELERLLAEGPATVRPPSRRGKG